MPQPVSVKRISAYSPAVTSKGMMERAWSCSSRRRAEAVTVTRPGQPSGIASAALITIFIMTCCSCAEARGGALFAPAPGVGEHLAPQPRRAPARRDDILQHRGDGAVKGVLERQAGIPEDPDEKIIEV